MKDENPNSMDSCSRVPSGRTGVGRVAGDSPVAEAGAPGQLSPGQVSPGQTSPGTGLPDPRLPDHPVLDRSGAMRRLELDAESYGQLLALMTLEVGGMLDALAEAWRNGDVAAMRQYAHRLKSEAANVGAEEVRFAASRLEQLLRQREGADSGAPPVSTTRFSPLESAGLSGQHVPGQYVSGQHMPGPHVLPPGEASAAVSHLRTALARLAAVLGQ